MLREDDAFFDKCLEGFTMFALNQGEVCTCPSRALIQESIYDEFIERAIARTKAVIQGNPLQMETMIGAQASTEQMEKITSYLKLGRDEGAEVLTGGDVGSVSGCENGNYIQPTIFKGNNKMRIFQEEIFGPVVSVTTFKNEAEALEIANDTLYGLGPVSGLATLTCVSAWVVVFKLGVFGPTAIMHTLHMLPLADTSSQELGVKTHKMMLDHYRQTKNMLVSYDENKLGFF